MSLSLKPFLAQLAAGATLDRAGAETVFDLIMSGEASEAQIGALLMAVSRDGFSAEVLAGAVSALRARMVPIEAPPGAIDVCGTGGDGAHTLNVSTAVAFVVAACGVAVAKHGNRGASSQSGGADVLAALGVELEVPNDALAGILERIGVAFLFAPRHHPALRHAASSRAALGFRTIFNLLGPLANPAGVRRQLVGCYDPGKLEVMARVLQAFGTEKAWIVHGQGLDELALSGPSTAVALEHGSMRHFTIDPESAGLCAAPQAALAGGDPAHNAEAMLALLRGERGAYRDAVLLNAAAALIIAERAGNLREGVAAAARAIDSGAALATLDSLLAASNLAAGKTAPAALVPRPRLVHEVGTRRLA